MVIELTLGSFGIFCCILILIIFFIYTTVDISVDMTTKRNKVRDEKMISLLEELLKLNRKDNA